MELYETKGQLDNQTAMVDKLLERVVKQSERQAFMKLECERTNKSNTLTEAKLKLSMEILTTSQWIVKCFCEDQDWHTNRGAKNNHDRIRLLIDQEDTESSVHKRFIAFKTEQEKNAAKPKPKALRKRKHYSAFENKESEVIVEEIDP